MRGLVGSTGVYGVPALCRAESESNKTQGSHHSATSATLPLPHWTRLVKQRFSYLLCSLPSSTEPGPSRAFNECSLFSDTWPCTCQGTHFLQRKHLCASYSHREQKQTLSLYGKGSFPLVSIMPRKGRHFWSFCSLLYPWHPKHRLGHRNYMLNYLSLFVE